MPIPHCNGCSKIDNTTCQHYTSLFRQCLEAVRMQSSSCRSWTRSMGLHRSSTRCFPVMTQAHQSSQYLVKEQIVLDLCLDIYRYSTSVESQVIPSIHCKSNTFGIGRVDCSMLGATWPLSVSESFVWLNSDWFSSTVNSGRGSIHLEPGLCNHLHHLHLNHTNRDHLSFSVLVFSFSILST